MRKANLDEEPKNSVEKTLAALNDDELKLIWQGIITRNLTVELDYHILDLDPTGSKGSLADLDKKVESFYINPLTHAIYPETFRLIKSEYLSRNKSHI